MKRITTLLVTVVCLNGACSGEGGESEPTEDLGVAHGNEGDRKNMPPDGGEKIVDCDGIPTPLHTDNNCSECGDACEAPAHCHWTVDHWGCSVRID